MIKRLSQQLLAVSRRHRHDVQPLQTFPQEMQHVLKELTTDLTDDSSTDSDFECRAGDVCSATTDPAKYRDCI